MMKERRGHYLGWKFPGGLVDPNESLPDAVTREVLEETGVETEFRGILTFRHVTAGLYPNTGDLYFLCHMKPKNESKIDVKPCPHEAADAQWLSRDAIKNLPHTEIHEFHHNILNTWDKLKESGRQGICVKSFDPKRPNMKIWDMYYVD